MAGLPFITGGLSGIGEKRPLLFSSRASAANARPELQKKRRNVKQKFFTKVLMAYLHNIIF
jgi:hypothetical protein